MATLNWSCKRRFVSPINCGLQRLHWVMWEKAFSFTSEIKVDGTFFAGGKYVWLVSPSEMQWQVAKIFSCNGKKSEGKERLGLVRFAGILAETIGSRRSIGKRLRTTICGCWKTILRQLGVRSRLQCHDIGDVGECWVKGCYEMFAYGGPFWSK